MTMLTLFSFGYYGWGNATPELVQAADAVEAGRGFKPPLFVDIRIRRSVRAQGFTGNAFGTLLGPQRHRWLKALGNRWIETRAGPPIQIVEPGAAAELLDLAQVAATRNQRLLFFCSCQWPRCDGDIACHRATVAELVLDVARRRGTAVEIVEWPGGEPGTLDREVSPEVLAAVRKGRATVPLGQPPDLAKVAGLPWGSVACLRAGGRTLNRVVGPAIRQKEQWAWPVLHQPAEAEPSLADCQQGATLFRQAHGLNPAEKKGNAPKQ